jgi:hypothetical protein
MTALRDGGADPKVGRQDANFAAAGFVMHFTDGCLLFLYDWQAGP